MDKDSKQVVVLLTHPNIKESRANKALMDAISDMGEVAIYNLYEMRMEDAFNAEIWSLPDECFGQSAFVYNGYGCQN